MFQEHQLKKFGKDEVEIQTFKTFSFFSNLNNFLIITMKHLKSFFN